MAGGQQWEVVGGKTKKIKSKSEVNKALKEKKKEKFSYEVSGPISESQTIYTAFLEREKKELPKPKTVVNENVKTKEKNVQSKKKKADKKTAAASSKISLEEMFSAISEDDIKNLLATLGVLCPESPLVWLKDLVSFFNLKLDMAIEDPTFSTKPPGYPSILLKKGVYNQMVKVFSRCTTQMLQVFFEFCLNGMVQDILKGLHTLGYRTILQCLAQEMPSVAIANLAKCTEFCNAHQNRQNVCLAVLWAAGQAGNNDLEAGFRVWIDLMFPLIGTKTCTNYAVDFLEKLVSSEDLQKINKSIIGVRDLFPILDFIYSKDLGKSIQKRLLLLYPTLKLLAYGPQPEAVLRNYFPSYLRRLEPQCPQPLKEEILNSLVHCLEKDTRSYSIWRQLYTKHFIQSKLLISHLNEIYEKLPPKFPRRSLLDTLSVFQVTNEELLSSGKKNPDVEDCININKELLSKMNAHVFSWFRLTLLFVLVCSMLVTFDVLMHNSFIESNTGKIMKDTGLLVICNQAGEKLSYYYGKVYKLLKNYTPVFIVWVRNTFGPYFEIFWKELARICVYFWNSTLWIRIWCNEHLPFVLDEIDKQLPVYVDKLSSITTVLVTFLSAHLQSAVKYLWYCAESSILWLQSNPHIANTLDVLVTYAGRLVEVMQQYAISTLQFIQSHVGSYT